MTPHAADHVAESFRGLLLQYRGRSGLTQRELAARIRSNRRTIQDWEEVINYPSAQRLQALITALLGSAGLAQGRGPEQAQKLRASAPGRYGGNGAGMPRSAMLGCQGFWKSMGFYTLPRSWQQTRPHR